MWYEHPVQKVCVGEWNPRSHGKSDLSLLVQPLALRFSYSDIIIERSREQELRFWQLSDLARRVLFKKVIGAEDYRQFYQTEPTSHWNIQNYSSPVHWHIKILVLKKKLDLLHASTEKNDEQAPRWF
jgi:hypothetical protein